MAVTGVRGGGQEAGAEAGTSVLQLGPWHEDLPGASSRNVALRRPWLQESEGTNPSSQVSLVIQPAQLQATQGTTSLCVSVSWPIEQNAVLGAAGD